MATIVQKYGGTSVGSPERIINVAKKIIKTKKQGHNLCVIASAMSGVTDSLIKLASEISDNPHRREMDMLLSTGEQASCALLSMALNDLGYDAVSMNAHQIGIYTDSAHTKAKIERIETEKICKELKAGKIVIVTGFQGIDEDLNITTLGRGGSDTSAVAIAVAVEADLCEIYTDVDGVYTTDPRICKNAKKIEKITYDEMLELASLGAKVLHSRSVEFAKKYNINLVVRSSFNEVEGTLVTEEDEEMEQVVVSGITSKKDEARVSITGVPNQPGIAQKIFYKLAQNNIVVNMIVQSSSSYKEQKINDISFTIPQNDLKNSEHIMEELKNELKALGVEYDNDIAIVSIVGIGMKSHSGVASDMFEVLAENDINIDMISTSEIKISVVIKKELADEAVRLLHAKFIEE